MTKIILYTNPPSPFGRRIHLALRRIGQIFETVEVGNLFPPPGWYTEINPLGLVPAIRIDSEQPVLDSSNILEYLDDKFTGIWPKEFQLHWKVKHISSLCSGVLHDAVSWRLEKIRENAREELLILREEVIFRTLKAVNGRIEADEKLFFGERKNQGSTDLAVTLQYLNFRLPHLEWEKKFPLMKEVLQDFCEDENFEKTAPV